MATDPIDGSMAIVFPYSGRILFGQGGEGSLSEVPDVIETRPDPEEIAYSPRENMVVYRLPPDAEMLSLSIALSPDEFWVLMNGDTQEENRIVDRYDRRTLSYLGSWRLPLHLNRITASGHRLVGIQTDLFPALFVLDPGNR